MCWADEKNVMNETSWGWAPKAPNHQLNMPCGGEFPHDFRHPNHGQRLSPVPGVNLSLRMVWQRPRNFAKQGQLVV